MSSALETKLNEQAERIGAGRGGMYVLVTFLLIRDLCFFTAPRTRRHRQSNCTPRGIFLAPARVVAGGKEATTTTVRLLFRFLGFVCSKGLLIGQFTCRFGSL